MGFVRKHTGIDLTGGGAVDAAGEAAGLQADATKRGLRALRADLEPFRAAGSEAANLLLGSVFEPGGQDPNQVLNNPFFQALSQQQDQNTLQQRAALGLAGSGGSQDALKRNLLQLGNQFQQQDLSNSLAQNQVRFNQLFNVSSLGGNAAAQTGNASLQANQSIGQARSAVPILGAQVASQQGQQLMSGLGAAFGAAGLVPGISSMFGGGSAIPSAFGLGGVGMGASGFGSIGL